MTDLPIHPDLVDTTSISAFSEDEACYDRPRGRQAPCAGTGPTGANSPVGATSPALPASATAVSGYLAALAGAGAKVGTMSWRLSAIRFVHQLRDQPDPTRNARVVAVWEGIRRAYGAPPEQSAPLMPPNLFDVVDACPTTKVWRTPNRASEPDLAGARDRALLLAGSSRPCAAASSPR